MRKCKTCKYASCGEPDPCSDICDECREDPELCWYGFTDHSVGKYFKTEEERKSFYKKNNIK